MKYVFCVGMYRSCSTWQYDVVSHLVESRRGGVRLGFVDGDAFAGHRVREVGNQATGVLKAHDAHPSFAEALAAGEALAVYAYRDMRDVAFSYMHKRQLDFNEIVGHRFLEKVLANDRFWRARPSLLCQRYEGLMADQVKGVNELAGHLGVGLPASEADTLAEEYSWASNLRRTMEVRREAEAAGLILTEGANAEHQHPVTLLHWNHLRPRGASGWRELATTAQRETLARLCGDWLIANGYERDTRWVVDPHNNPPPAAPGGRGVDPVRRPDSAAGHAPASNRWRAAGRPGAQTDGDASARTRAD